MQGGDDSASQTTERPRDHGRKRESDRALGAGTLAAGPTERRRIRLVKHTRTAVVLTAVSFSPVRGAACSPAREEHACAGSVDAKSAGGDGEGSGLLG